MSVYLPEPNRVVIATLESSSGCVQLAELVHVNEDDVTWRTADDLSELNEWAFGVTAWYYKDE